MLNKKEMNQEGGDNSFNIQAEKVIILDKDKVSNLSDLNINDDSKSSVSIDVKLKIAQAIVELTKRPSEIVRVKDIYNELIGNKEFGKIIPKSDFEDALKELLQTEFLQLEKGIIISNNFNI